MTTYTIRNLSVLSYAQGFTLWHYRGGEGVTLEQVSAPGFFDPAADGIVSRGDMILVSTRNGGRVLFVEHAKAGEGVTTGPLT